MTEIANTAGAGMKQSNNFSVDISWVAERTMNIIKSLIASKPCPDLKNIIQTADFLETTEDATKRTEKTYDLLQNDILNTYNNNFQKSGNKMEIYRNLRRCTGSVIQYVKALDSELSKLSQEENINPDTKAKIQHITACLAVFEKIENSRDNRILKEWEKELRDLINENK